MREGMGKYGRLKGLCRQLLGKDHADLNSFDEKIAIQKGVYLAKWLGAKSFDEYEFGWYVRGPYSSRLTVDIYHLPKETQEPAELSPAEKEILSRIKKLQEGSQKSMSSLLEVASAVVYAFKEKRMNTEEAKVFTRRTKPWFSEEEITHAIRWAQEQGLASG